MPIRVNCNACGTQMNVADKFAGKRAKCPKCEAPIDIPKVSTGAEDDLSLADEAPKKRTDPTTKGWGATPTRSHLDDLLDEAGVKAAVEGPVCPGCGAGIQPGAVICIDCGLNFQTGERVATLASAGAMMTSAKAMSENEKIMAKAEAAIEENPITQEDMGYGDGPESYLIAGAALLIGTLLVAAIVGTIFLFDRITNSTGATVTVMVVVGAIFQVIGMIWISVAAFRENVGHGIATLLCPLYTMIFGVMRMGGLWMPTICLIIGWVAVVVASAMLAFEGAKPITS